MNPRVVEAVAGLEDGYSDLLTRLTGSADNQRVRALVLADTVGCEVAGGLPS